MLKFCIIILLHWTTNIKMTKYCGWSVHLNNLVQTSVSNEEYISKKSIPFKLSLSRLGITIFPYHASCIHLYMYKAQMNYHTQWLYSWYDTIVFALVLIALLKILPALSFIPLQSESDDVKTWYRYPLHKWLITKIWEPTGFQLQSRHLPQEKK